MGVRDARRAPRGTAHWIRSAGWTAGACLLLLGAAAVAAPAAAATAGVTATIRVRRARITGASEATQKFRRFVESQRAKLLACYAAVRRSRPGAVGIFAASVRIGPAGDVTELRVRPTRLAAPLKTCVSARVRAWRIPKWSLRHRVYAQLELIFQLEAAPARGATIKGGLPERVVAGVFEARLPGLRAACLRGATPKRPVQLRVTVDFDGTVQTAGLYGRLRGRATRSCLVDALRKWVFPPPDNGHRTFVFYPLRGARRR